MAAELLCSPHPVRLWVCGQVQAHVHVYMQGAQFVQFVGVYLWYVCACVRRACEPTRVCVWGGLPAVWAMAAGCPAARTAMPMLVVVRQRQHECRSERIGTVRKILSYYVSNCRRRRPSPLHPRPRSLPRQKYEDESSSPSSPPPPRCHIRLCVLDCWHVKYDYCRHRWRY